MNDLERAVLSFRNGLLLGQEPLWRLAQHARLDSIVCCARGAVFVAATAAAASVREFGSLVYLYVEGLHQRGFHGSIVLEQVAGEDWSMIGEGFC